MLKAIRWAAFAVPAFSTLAAAPQATAPLYTVVLASATTQAIRYPFLDGSTLIGFRGTALEPSAKGQAWVRGADGRMKIHAHFKRLGPANRFGPEYLTYVLWSISPMGRPINLGEVVATRGKAKVDAISNLQTFGLIVTAEPHFAVTRVSHAVVLENIPQKDTRPPMEEVEARFDLLDRGSYALEQTQPAAEDRTLSPYVYQARNAMRIAKVEQADELAPSEYQKALDHLNRMEGGKNLRCREAVLWARRTVQQAEEARLVAEKQREARLLAQERERARDAQAKADSAVALAEAARAAAAQEAQRANRQERAASEAVKKATEAQLATRRKLQERLNRLLRTRETGEGLLVSLTDVAFASGRSQLAPNARVNLAKVSGILLGHPGLKFRVLGHTDSTGSQAFNERLSRQRADAVRTFLAQQGVPPGSIEALGVNGSNPIASDATPQGRRMNRRVDIIVSGEPIGL